MFVQSRFNIKSTNIMGYELALSNENGAGIWCWTSELRVEFLNTLSIRESCVLEVKTNDKIWICFFLLLRPLSAIHLGLTSLGDHQVGLGRHVGSSLYQQIRPTQSARCSWWGGNVEACSFHLQHRAVLWCWANRRYKWLFKKTEKRKKTTHDNNSERKSELIRQC